MSTTEASTLTYDVFVTHGHGDHWFAAGPLVERFGARVVASAGTIAQMEGNAATRPLLCVVCGHQNRELDDDAERTIAETRQYLDDAEELLRRQPSALDFFNAKIERYPDHLGRTVLWAGVQTLYGVREHPDEDVRKIVLASWF